MAVYWIGGAYTAFVDAGRASAALHEENLRFDLTVTDYNMLAMSGPDVARELLAIRPGWPVIISSGYETDELLASGSGRSLTNQVQPSAWPWRSQKSLRCELR
jgi:CheY-like chemotaxis protein